MGATILFCFVFLSQVLMLSWFYPRRIISRARYQLQNFPPSTHPKGYPLPVEDYERWLRNIARINFTVVVAGLVIIGLILATLAGGWGAGNFRLSRKTHWDGISGPFFIVQFFAGYMYIHLSSRKFALAMARVPRPRVRTAELRRRRIFDFVSPMWLVVAVLANVAFVAFVLYYPRPEFPGFKALNIATAAAGPLAFIVAIGFALRASNPDPYRAPKDRHDGLKLVVQQALGFCIVYPVLMTASFAIKLVDPTLLQPVNATLLLQGFALALLWPTYSYRTDKIDFDVYREDAKDSTLDASAGIGSP